MSSTLRHNIMSVPAPSTRPAGGLTDLLAPREVR